MCGGEVAKTCIRRQDEGFESNQDSDFSGEEEKESIKQTADGAVENSDDCEDNQEENDGENTSKKRIASLNDFNTTEQGGTLQTKESLDKTATKKKKSKEDKESTTVKKKKVK